MPRERDDNERESIWSVPKSTKTAYFALFFIHLVAGIALLIWRGDRVHETLADHVLYIWLNSGSIVLGSAGAALFYTDIGRYLLVLSRSLEEKLERTRERRREEGRVEGREEGRVEGREEGREEGRVEERAEWSVWLARMREAQAKGEPFDEPAPTEKNGQP